MEPPGIPVRFTIVAAEGAMDAAHQAVVMLAHADQQRVVVLFDEDSEGRTGKGALDRLSNKLDRLTYAKWVDAKNVEVEAEDVFPDAVMKRYLEDVGTEGRLCGSKQRPGTSDWHFDLTEQGKSGFVSWLERNAKVDELHQWAQVIAELEVLAERQRKRLEKRARGPENVQANPAAAADPAAAQ